MPIIKHLTPKTGTPDEKKAKIKAYLEGKGYTVREENIVIEGNVTKVKCTTKN